MVVVVVVVVVVDNDDDVCLLYKYRMCVFCEVEDDNFTEATLNKHYIEDCPMLYQCPHCSQVYYVLLCCSLQYTELYQPPYMLLSPRWWRSPPYSSTT